MRLARFCTAPLSERPCGLLMPWICPSACPARSLLCNPRPLLRRGSFGSLLGLRWKQLRMLATTPMLFPTIGLFGSWFPACCFSAVRASACSANLSGATASPRSMPAVATSLVRLGELSAASSALAPLSQATLAELRDPERRPSEPYGDIDSALLQFQPESPVRLPPGLLLASLRRARRGAGAGPSGLTAECCRVVLGDDRTSELFVSAAQALAQAQVPPAVAAFDLGCIVAVQKLNSRVRGIVVSDFLRRLVARSFAQHFAATLQEACAPFQFGLSTRMPPFYQLMEFGFLTPSAAPIRSAILCLSVALHLA